MFKKEKIVRNSFGPKDTVRLQLDQSYASPLIEKIRAAGFRLKESRLDIHLAKEFGFCYGVERAVEYAYETRARFPERRIFLTDEIIHNPRVNRELRDLGIQFLTGPSASGVKIDELGAKDVVIMPAFGVPVDALKKFQERGCVIVDTTCGSVMSVWKRVESYARDGFTAVIHGKFDHEETKATCSRAGKYLVVKDPQQAELVCDYIREPGSGMRRDQFLKVFRQACSPDFDPDRDLEKIGSANQTTMLMRESVGISDAIRQALEERYGKKEATGRVRHFDTICSATQDRQDAIRELGEQGMDLILVIGGYKSSNTGHLAEIASGFAKTFHIEDADCILSKEKISHRGMETHTITETSGWLKKGGQAPFPGTGSPLKAGRLSPLSQKGQSLRSGTVPDQPDPLKVGITAGASTPNRVIEEVIRRLIKIAD